MNYMLSLDEDNLCQSLPVTAARPPSPSYLILASVMFLVLLTFSLSACGERFDSTCSDSKAPILSACTPSAPPKHTHKVSHPHTKIKKLKPTPGPLPPPLPTPSPTPPVVTRALIMKTVTHYIDLVLVEERYREAYALLSAAVRAQEPFDDFVKNPNYTLFSSCWRIGAIMASSLNSQRGIANVQLTQVSCSDDSPIAYYDWVIRFQIEHNCLLIVSIGLYPAAPANSSMQLAYHYRW